MHFSSEADQHLVRQKHRLCVIFFVNSNCLIETKLIPSICTMRNIIWSVGFAYFHLQLIELIRKAANLVNFAIPAIQIHFGRGASSIISRAKSELLLISFRWNYLARSGERLGSDSQITFLRAVRSNNRRLIMLRRKTEDLIIVEAGERARTKGCFWVVQSNTQYLQLSF